MKFPPAFVGTTVLLWLGFAVTTAACQRAAPTPSESQSSARPSLPATTQAALVAKPTQAEFKRHEAPGKVFAVGDLHGDLLAAKRTFRVAQLIDAADAWIGGNSVVVQTGDVLDRGNDERALLDWLERLAQAAQAGGGALYRLNGNHEIMNVAGDLRYVTPAGFTEFAEYARGPLPAGLSDAPEAQRGRLAAFLPGGYWAKRLARFPVVLQVNDTVFTHGGLTPKHLEYGLERMNSEIASWMQATRPLPKALQGDDTPFWDRTYGASVSDSDCKTLDHVLAKLSAKRLVIGHTPQKDGVTFACDGRVARVDVGVSSYYGRNAAAVLKIENAAVEVISEADASQKNRPKATPRHQPEARP